MTGSREAREATDAGFGLRPRPDPDPLVLGLVAAAVDQAWPRAVAVEDAPRPRHLAWRFSGRWWARPLPARRERPWLG